MGQMMEHDGTNEAEPVPAAPTDDAAPPPPPPAPVLTRSQRRERAAADVLRTAVRDVYLDRFGAELPPQAEVELNLRLRVRPGENWALEFAPGLHEQIIAQMAEAQALREAFVPGRVYCFRCSSCVCEHAAPPSLTAVFRGYSQLGVPEWHDFTQALIAVQDERVDQLFGKPPRIVALIQFGRELRDQQLSSFGRASKTYAILGQVTAGYFRLPQGADNKLAVTFQIVETRSRAGVPQYHLNAITALPGEKDFEDLLRNDWEPALLRARDLAARELDTIARRASGALEADDAERVRGELRRIPTLLRRLAESLERGARQADRRTRHAEVRRQEQRPVAKALDDAAAVADAALYFDEKSAAVIVRGDANRTHAFNPAGRHITSFFLEPAAMETRLRTHRWRALAPDEIATFRTALAGTAAGGQKTESRNQ